MNTESIAISFAPQDPTAVLDYQLLFAERLALIFPATIVGVGWSVAPIAGDAAPLAVVAHTEDAPITQSIVRISGGTLGYTYAVRCALSYSDGEGETVSFTVEIANT